MVIDLADSGVREVRLKPAGCDLRKSNDHQLKLVADKRSAKARHPGAVCPP
jgi:hypothetical protein